MNVNNVDRELGWEDQINKDQEFVLFPAGEYDFKVVGFERARHAGSANLPACNKAIISIEIQGLFDGQVKTLKLKHNLFLHTKTEGMLSAFFSSIGLKKKGEPLQMNWNSVTGSTGKCSLGIKVYNDNEYNEIKKFHPKEAVVAPNQFTPGNF